METAGATWLPRLRPDLLQVRASDGSLAGLHDPIVVRDVNLGERALALVPLLDGTRPVETILAAAGAALPAKTREEIEAAFRSFLLLNLVEGAGTSVLERMLEARRRPRLEPVTLAGSRFACQGSGACCQNYAFGPLTGEDVERLAGLDIAGRLPGVGPGPWTEEISRPGGKALFLRTRDDRCVFLQEDQRCGIHATFGSDAKPGFCRQYPIRTLATVSGLKVFDAGECATFAVSSASGPLLGEDLPRILALGEARPTIHHPVVFVAPEVPCDFGHLLALQAGLVAQLERSEAPADEALRRALAGARSVAETLAACPLGPGEPDASLARALAGIDSAPAPLPDTAAFEGLARLADELLASVMPSVFAASNGRPTRKLEPQLVVVLRVIEALAREAGDPESPACQDFQRIARVPIDRALADATLRRSLANTLFGDRLLVGERLAPGALRLAVTHLAAVAAAKLRAHVEGAPAVRAGDLSFGHHLASRVFRQSAPVKAFEAHEREAWGGAFAATQLLGRWLGGGHRAGFP